MVVYYRGRNDAWAGYGGATVYTRGRALDAALVPELKAVVDNAGLGLKWEDFIITDNACGPRPPPPTLAAELEADVEAVEAFAAREAAALEAAGLPGLRSFGRGFTVIERDLEGAASALERGVEAEEAALARELRREADAAAAMLGRFRAEAAGAPRWASGLPAPLRALLGQRG